jgi:hypothetical protein
MAQPRTVRPARPVKDDATVTLNLDTYEIEKPDQEFSFVLGGRLIECINPNDVDWRDLAAIDDPDEFADVTMQEKDATYFKEFKPFPAAKLNAVLDAYRSHYGLGKPGN